MIDAVPPLDLPPADNMQAPLVSGVNPDAFNSDPHAQYQFAAEVESLRGAHNSQSVASLDFAGSLMTEFGRHIQQNDEQNAKYLQETADGLEDRLSDMRRHHTELLEASEKNEVKELTPGDFSQMLADQQKMSIEGLEMAIKLEEVKYHSNRNTIDLMVSNNVSKQTQETLRRLTSEG